MSDISTASFTITESNAQVYKKVAWRLVPFLCICYLAAYLDRVNVGFAKLQMLSDLSSVSYTHLTLPTIYSV